MRVRYLGREERVNYAVEVDAQGKLCWKRNGVRVNTNEEWRDSIKGIVRVEDDAPSPSPGLGFYVSSSESSSLSGADHSDSGSTAKEKRPKPAVAAAVEHTLKDFIHDAKARALDHRPFRHPPKEPGEKKKKKKKNLWIYVCTYMVVPIVQCPFSDLEQVADTSYNLYIGIKQSGAFQHSSFLHGARVSAAGVIQVKDGKLQCMATPLSPFIYSLSVLTFPSRYAATKRTLQAPSKQLPCVRTLAPEA